MVKHGASLLLLLCMGTMHAQFPKKLVVHVPVCDVRSVPQSGEPFDQFQETQLLHGDRVIAYEEHNGFLHIKALDQRNYPGWIRGDNATEVPEFPARSPIITVADRGEFIAHAMRFDRQPYCWGGCSGPVSLLGVPTGVDCSGLVYLCARYCGIKVSRNARDQFNDCTPVATLQRGDLIFTAPVSAPTKIDHVLIYLGDDWVIEARGQEPQTGVRIIGVPERFVGGEILYYRTFFTD